jgi:hypothetical protein
VVQPVRSVIFDSADDIDAEKVVRAIVGQAVPFVKDIVFCAIDINRSNTEDHAHAINVIVRIMYEQECT